MLPEHTGHQVSVVFISYSDMNLEVYLVCPFDMNFNDQVPVFVLHVLKTDIPQYSRIVDQNVNTSKFFDSSLDDLLAVLDAIIICNCFPTGGSYLIDNYICGLEYISVSYTGKDNLEQSDTFEDFPSPLNEPPRSFTTTLAPLEPKNVAYAFPRPPPAPVTTTV